MSKKALIIGGNRFFGRHLAKELLKKKFEVTLFNRQSLDDRLGSDVLRVKGDRDQYDSFCGVAQSQKWDFVFDQVCFTATQAKQSCLHFEGRVGRYIVTSTQSVYDYGADLREENFKPEKYEYTKEAERLQDYGEAKRQMESVFYKNAKFPVTAVRFPIVLGLDDYTQRLGWHVDRLKTQKGVFFPDLSARMGFVDSFEAGRVLSELTEVNWSQPLNVASPEAISMKELLGRIERAAGLKFHFTTQDTPESHSPFGIKQDWFMNVEPMQKLGLRTSSLTQWLPELIQKLVNEPLV